ncbi:hypothetical protein IQ06DRAFT_349060 [Phaeosphaeriaceae sp. SRC1lsM3a]|nr:hypothetical protein IQ06DRAFT_349060 [Stagonospora sp. SRC1lsM3a]
MSFEFELPDLPPMSRTSSSYSEDFITMANNTGTLFHHRSHLRPSDDGTPRPYHEIRDRVLGPSSSLNLIYEGDARAADRMGMNLAFETVEEAEARRRWSATLARADTPRSVRSSVEHDNSVAVRAPLANIDLQYIGTRPPTPRRRRPTIPGLNNRYSHSSHPSASNSWVTITDNQMYAEFARGANPLTQGSPLRAVHSADVLRPKKDASRYMLPPTNVRPSRSKRQAHQNPRRQLIGRPQPIYTHNLGRNSLTDSSSDYCKVNMDEIVPMREALSWRTPVQHRVATDRFGQVVIDTIVENPEEPQPLVLAPECVRGQGNLDAGYVNGEYVTDLQPKKPKAKLKSRSVIKCIFCF